MSGHNDVYEREQRAMKLSGGNRLRCALLLDRWAGVLAAEDPALSRSLKAAAKRIVGVEVRFASIDTGKKMDHFWHRKNSGRAERVRETIRVVREKNRRTEEG